MLKICKSSEVSGVSRPNKSGPLQTLQRNWHFEFSVDVSPPLLKQQRCSLLILGRPPHFLGKWGGRSQSKTDLASSPQPCWLLPCVYNIYLLLLQTFDTDGNSFESGTPTLDTAAFIFLMFWLQLQPFFNIHEV